MLADRWRLLDRLFAEAAALPAGERDEFLRGACGPDVQLRNEIAALLVAMEDSGEFLAASALEMFARQVSREGWNVSVGDRIGAYVVERRLGAGGMGEVWRARDERLDRNVAIKLLLPHPSNAGDRAFELLRREARAASALNHPNVLTVYDVGEHGGAPYLVTECLEGESLRARLSSSGALSVDAALDVARQVASGLGAAHRQGMVHRDLKPENLFLVAGGTVVRTGAPRERERLSERVKILDFGLATLRLAQELTQVLPTQEPNTPETAGSLLAGTAGYMAPEQVRGEIVDVRADVFALGAILHEMVAGRGPFQRESTVATLDAVLTQSPTDLSKLRPDVTPDLSRVVLRCLAKDPKDRFATAAEVAEALDAVIRARNLPPPPGLLATLRRPAVMAVAFAVVLGIAAGGWRWRATTQARSLGARRRRARNTATPRPRRLPRSVCLDPSGARGRAGRSSDRAVVARRVQPRSSEHRSDRCGGGHRAVPRSVRGLAPFGPDAASRGPHRARLVSHTGFQSGLSDDRRHRSSRRHPDVPARSAGSDRPGGSNGRTSAGDGARDAHEG